jgi:hypothetical protein
VTAVRGRSDGAEPVLGPSAGGSVLVDVGPSRGALVVTTTPARRGRELEIRRAGTAWAGEHVAVRERRLRSGTVFAALFPSLPVGRYDVRWRPGGPALLRGVTVGAGGVTQIADPTH